jgi:hypothetical protein
VTGEDAFDAWRKRFESEQPSAIGNRLSASRFLPKADGAIRPWLIPDG